MKEDKPDGQAYRQHYPGLTILNPVAFLAAVRPQAEAPE